jgi:hypothetical protein
MIQKRKWNVPTNLALLHVLSIDILYIDQDLYGTVILQNERVALEDCWLIKKIQLHNKTIK